MVGQARSIITKDVVPRGVQRTLRFAQLRFLTSNENRHRRICQELQESLESPKGNPQEKLQSAPVRP